jgi:hypothetical protein
MRWAAVASRAQVDLARISLGVGNKLGDALDRHRRINLQHRRRLHDACNRHNAFYEIEIEVGIKRSVDRVRLGDEKQRVAVGVGVYRRLGGDVATGTRPVLDDQLLAEPLRQPLADEACADVGWTSGRITDEQEH